MLNVVLLALFLLVSLLIGVVLCSGVRRRQVRQWLSVVFSRSGYQRRRVVVSLALLLMMGLGLFAQNGLAEGTIQQISSGFRQVIARSQFVPTTLQLAAHPLPVSQSAHSQSSQSQAAPQMQSASTRLMRVDSAARAQYASDYEWETWAYSSCSGIALETVMNAYGRHLIASNVLQVEQNLGVWNVQLGLLRDDGIALTAAQFGFATSSSHSLTLDQVVAIANQGAPVIVSVRDAVNFPGGHIFVVRGGDAQSVFVVDSSLLNLHSLTRAQFLAMWQGFSAVVTPPVA